VAARVHGHGDGGANDGVTVTGSVTVTVTVTTRVMVPDSVRVCRRSVMPAAAACYGSPAACGLPVSSQAGARPPSRPSS
jgi:hypothetical protein